MCSEWLQISFSPVNSLLEVKVTAGRHRFYGLTGASKHNHLKRFVTGLTNETPLLFVRLKSSLLLVTFALFTKHYTAPVMGFYIDEWTDYGKHQIPESSQSRKQANFLSGQNAFEIALKTRVGRIELPRVFDLNSVFILCVSAGVMGEYEPKIEVQFPEVVPVAKSSTVKLECFALGKYVPLRVIRPNSLQLFCLLY